MEIAHCNSELYFVEVMSKLRYCTPVANYANCTPSERERSIAQITLDLPAHRTVLTCAKDLLERILLEQRVGNIRSYEMLGMIVLVTETSESIIQLTRSNLADDVAVFNPY